MPPPPSGSSPQSPTNPSASPSTDNNDNEPSSSRMSRDSEGYPSWLPKRPPPPAPASTFQSSMMGLHDTSPSPVEPPFVGGRKPTPRSVRIVNLQDEFAGAAENDGTFTREPTDQTRVGVNAPPRVWTRASGLPPTAFNTSEQDGFLPLPQPRFNAKNLHLQILRNPSPWMKLYFYIWPLLVFYHIPLQTFFDFNAVYTLLQVAKNPNPGSSGKNWALGAAAYIACCMAAMTSYTNFSFLQHLRYSAFVPDAADAIAPQSASDPDQDVDGSYEGSSLKQGLAETCFLYSQNTPTVALLLPRAGLSLALLLAYWTVQPLFVNSGTTNKRDRTFFREDGTLTNYARGVLIANAAWAAWRILVLIVSWLGLWFFSNQRLGGLCGPRHTWDEYEQEKTRSAFSEAASEHGAFRGGYQHNGEGDSTYGGDELAWEWRENTRMRVQDAFEFCLNRRKSRSDSLRWSAASPGPGPAHGYSYGYRSRRNRAAHQHHRRRSTKGKEPLNEKPEERRDEPFEGIEKVLAAVGFPATASPAKRGVLSKDLFAGPLSSSPTEQLPITDQPGPSSGMFATPETPKMAKRNSKDRIPGSSTAGAPLLSLPYPFSKPGSGQVSSKDLVPFPGSSQEQVVAGSKNSKASKSKSSGHTSEEESSSASGTSTGSGSGSGEGEAGAEEEEEEEEEDDDDDLGLDEEDEDDDDFASEDPSSGRGSESMSSLGHPISPGRYPFGMRRPGGAGHRRNASGVSSGMSSGPVVSSGSHGHSQSMSSSYGVGGVSVLTQSTGNRPSIDSERPRASLSQDSNASPSMPMPRRHPHPQTRNRQSYSSSGSSGAAAAALATLNMFPQPVAFPTTQPRRRADSGTGVPVDPELLYGEGIGSDIENQHEFHDDDNDEDDEDDEDEHGEREDRLGLLVPSPRASIIGGSRISLTNSSSSHNDSRSRTHSHHSSRSRHSSTRARTQSSHGSASVRERASSLGSSVRSLVTGARASLTQLDVIMRGATGPAAGLGGVGSRPRSRVNSSMARLEEDPVAEMSERGRGASGQSSGSSGSQGDVAPHPLVGRGRRVAEVEAEGYSSGGTHSRSGSESMNTENYTFGRPVLFMRPNPEGQQHAPVEEENDDEIVVMERSPRNSARNSRQNSRRGSPRQSGVPMVMRTQDGGHQGVPHSISSASFYSPQDSERTASPRRSRRSSATGDTPERSPERRGVDIPGRQRFLSPEWAASSQAQGGEPTNVSESPPDISTAAGSFVTAAPTFDGTATTTDSSGRRTVASSWDQNAPAIGMRLGNMGGMVERPGEDMGAGAAAWRVR
ncbi:hypothetical protein CPB83DRAFT_887000 [Crepidotus variabilis]|uniref:Proteophosphoglycan ppg4 n=1 Tax=Crepidotus variabilis TaxID=179855 RepID=A0A9P6E6L0_9AGAR|nr:hypothetical protein CPB83DRAFT_887000 [Crepidotus variabilis]